MVDSVTGRTYPPSMIPFTPHPDQTPVVFLIAHIEQFIISKTILSS